MLSILTGRSYFRCRNFTFAAIVISAPDTLPTDVYALSWGLLLVFISLRTPIKGDVQEVFNKNVKNGSKTESVGGDRCKRSSELDAKFNPYVTTDRWRHRRYKMVL